MGFELYGQIIEFNETIVMIWITVLVLYLILKRFFFEKVHNFMQARDDLLRESFDHADQVNAQAAEKLLDYQKQMENVEGEGREIIKAAKLKAESIAKEITEEANKKANEMILQARKQIDSEQEQAVSEMREQIAALAIYAAEKIIERQLEQTGQDEFVQRIIEQAGMAKWQS